MQRILMVLLDAETLLGSLGASDARRQVHLPIQALVIAWQLLSLPKSPVFVIPLSDDVFLNQVCTALGKSLHYACKIDM
jgi:hypothetical protein